MLGPGREVPPPPDVAEVLIGYFGPDDPEDPVAGGMWRAAVWPWRKRTGPAVIGANRSGWSPLGPTTRGRRVSVCLLARSIRTRSGRSSAGSMARRLIWPNKWSPRRVCR
jgi:hypothetical protein